jgi:hypothetical protein
MGLPRTTATGGPGQALFCTCYRGRSQDGRDVHASQTHDIHTTWFPTVVAVYTDNRTREGRSGKRKRIAVNFSVHGCVPALNRSTTDLKRRTDVRLGSEHERVVRKNPGPDRTTGNRSCIDAMTVVLFESEAQQQLFETNVSTSARQFVSCRGQATCPCVRFRHPPSEQTGHAAPRVSASRRLVAPTRRG